MLIALAVPLGLALALGLVATSSDAVTVALAEVWDDDGEAEPELDADGEAEPDCDGESAAEGDADAEFVGELCEGEVLGLLLVAAELLGEGLGEEVDGFGDGEFEGFGVGVGVGVADTGSTWHFVSVFALALGELLALGVAAADRIAPARAVPGRLISTPRTRNPPASKLSAATRTCAKRMYIALSVDAAHQGYCVLFV